MPNPNSIRNRVLLASLTLKAWTPTKTSKPGAEIVSRETGARESVIKVRKTLINTDTPSYRTLVKTISAARTAHYDLTLDWVKDGMRVLPAPLADLWTTQLSDCQDAFNAALNDFIREYWTLADMAKNALGDLFNPDDYPSTNQLRDHYGFKFQLLPLPSQDVLTQLSDATLTKVQNDTNEMLAQTVARAQACYVERLTDALTLAHTRLAGEGTFHGTLITNLRDLCEHVRAFNVADNVNITELADRLCNGLARTSPTTLRENPTARAQAAAEASKALAEINAIKAQLDDIPAGVF